MHTRQCIQDDNFRHRLYALGKSCFKVDCAHLVAKHHPLSLRARTAERDSETRMPREIPTLSDRDDYSQA
ncbi:hypothetical protein J3A98_004034 [Pseudomonas sp. BP6]|nr:hypothetical protein [Pseudomonas sp. BP6]MBP2287688.1 hypothetical protein [Pseudomonas sp. BP7]